MKNIRNNTQQRAQRGNKLMYGETIALSMLAYARTNKTFATIIRNQGKNLHKYHTRILNNTEKLHIPDIRIIMPVDIQAGVRRLLWLKDNSASIAGAREGLNALTNTENLDAFEDPRIVPFTVGVYKIAIPGVTMGRYKKREKKVVVVRDDVMRNYNVGLLTKKINKAGAGVIYQVLRAAGGSMYKLEPEVGDWLSGNRSITVYTAGLKNIEKITKDLKQLGIIYSQEEDDKGVSVIAISPVINSVFQLQHWNAKELSE